MLPSPRVTVGLLSGVLTMGVTCSAFAASATPFSDVKANDFAADAIVYLNDRSIVSGYADGTFKPNRSVNRAEALKIIASGFIPKTETVKLQSADFTDVPDNAWYLPALDWALTKRVIDGPPKATSFHPTRTVTKAEFLKMLFVSYGVDPKAFGDIALPISPDVSDPKAWYFPSLRYAVATATTMTPDSGALAPNRELTRADVALLLYRFLLYRDGQRTQDLLTETRKNVEGVITSLSKADAQGAEFASVRAILIARAALLTEPDQPVVKVAVKIAEGYRALTRAYRASQSGDVQAVLKLSGDAKTLAGQARKISGDAKTLADQLEKYATSFSAQAKKK